MTTNNLFYGKTNLSNIKSLINNELKLLVEWIRANQLSLREFKTKKYYFHPPRKQNAMHSWDKVNNYQSTNNVIDLDEVLPWNKLIETLSKKLNRINIILSKLQYYVIFYQSHNTYGSLISCFIYHKNFEKLILLQNRCIRLITFSDHC